MIPRLGNIMFVASLLLVVLLATLSHAKIYSKCDLAKELGKNGISRTFYGNWICLANAESGMDTSKVTRLPNLTASYGIFQINSKQWCRAGRKGGVCNMKCEDFLDDNISNDIECVKIIQSRLGFNGWPVWVKKCKGKELPNISNCNL